MRVNISKCGYIFIMYFGRDRNRGQSAIKGSTQITPKKKWINNFYLNGTSVGRGTTDLRWAETGSINLSNNMKRAQLYIV